MKVPALSPLFSLSAPAAFAGALAFSAALTPSLVPRSGMLQGGLAGLAFVAAYLVVVIGLLIWQGLGLRLPSGRGAEITSALLKAGAALVAGLALAHASGWQNEIRLLMGMEPVETVRPLTIGLTAALVILLLIWIGRLFRLAVTTIELRLSRHLPPRLAFLIGLIAAVFLFNLLGNDVLLSRVYRSLDSSYAKIDRALAEDQPAPSDSNRSGGPGSLVNWQDLGAEGRSRISDPLDAAGITAITGRPALEPLRVYIGLGSAGTPEERAELALQEAIRIGAFERRRLVIATPTGTGWVDPAAMVPLEVITDGDVATISVQYSYLPSWLSLLTVQSYGVQTAQATFLAFHRHWLSLPEEARPEFWLFGLSLGALHSDLSADLYDLLGAPYTGAFRAGPPFAGQSWQHLTLDRDPQSPVWRPVFSGGRVVRFVNQLPEGQQPAAEPEWGPVRILYLQYPSDGITFFSPSLLWRAPEWLAGPRAADVSPNLRWLPLVTFFQVGFDLLTATTTPKGYGHVYAARDYLYGWQALFSDPPLSRAAYDRLNSLFEARDL